jgi:hypothetical protein
VPEAQVPADMGPEVHLPVELDTEMELANEQIPMGLEAVLEPEDDHFIVYVIIYLFILFILTKINLICEESLIINRKFKFKFFIGWSSLSPSSPSIGN